MKRSLTRFGAVQCLALCLGASCQVNVLPDDENTAPLDQVTGTLNITQNASTNAGSATLALAAGGEPLVLSEGQSVLIDGAALASPTLVEPFTRTITPAGQHTVTVSEPTRGVESTTILMPTSPAISAPAPSEMVSLSQPLIIAWTPTDAGGSAEISLAQTTGVAGTQTRTFQVAVDTGTTTLTAADLAGLVHGSLNGQLVTLQITVSRIRSAQATTINGLAAATLTTRSSTTMTVIPGP